MRTPVRGSAPLMLPLLLLLAVSLEVTGCGADRLVQPMSERLQEMVNDSPPTANASILAQAMLGDPAKISALYALAAGPAGSYGFRGYLDGRLRTGVLGSDGRLVSSQALVYQVRSLCSLAPASPAPATFLMAGAHDVDGDGSSELGYVTLCSYAGVVQDQVLVSSDTSDVWLNDVTPVTDSTFLLAGGERRGLVQYPFLAYLAVTPDRHLALRARTTIASRPDQNLWKAVVFPPAPGSDDILFAALLGGAGVGDRIDAFRVTLPDLADASPVWSRRVIVTTGPVVDLNAITRIGDDLYVVGQADDDRKSPLPLDGGYWDSGLAASYTRAGDPRWIALVGVSAHTEAFSDVVATPGALFAIGRSHYYLYEHPGQVTKGFGYGLVSRLDPATGSVAANLSVGDERYSSGFYGGTYADGAVTCVGYTAWDVSGGPSLGWFCRIDPGGAGAPGPPARASVAAPGARRAPMPPRAPGAPRSRRG